MRRAHGTKPAPCQTPGMLDSATWGAFALTLTVLGAAGTWLAFRRRGPRSGVRWLAATLLVPAAYFTRTLRMLGRIADAVTDWAASFVWNPLVWVGLGLAAVSALLFVVSGRLPTRKPARKPVSKPVRKAAGDPAITAGDPDLTEIEELLKRRGIT